MAELGDAGGPLRHRRHADLDTGGASDRAWKRAFEELQGVDVDVPGRDRQGRSRPGGGEGGLRAGDRPRADRGGGGGADAPPPRPPTRGGPAARRATSSRTGSLSCSNVCSRTASCSASPPATSRRPRTSSSPAPTSIGSSASADSAPILRTARSSPRWRSSGASLRLGSHPPSGPELLLWRHPSRRGGRPRRRYPGGGRRHRRVHEQGACRGRRRCGGPFARGRPSAPLGRRRNASRLDGLIRHMRAQPPFARAPWTVSRSYSIGWTSRHSLPKGSRKPASTP